MGYFSCEKCNEEIDQEDYEKYKRLRLEIDPEKWKHVVYCMLCYVDIGHYRFSQGNVKITIIRQVQKDDTTYKLYHLTEMNRVNIKQVIDTIKDDHRVAIVYDGEQETLSFDLAVNAYHELVAYKPDRYLESWAITPTWPSK